MGVRLVSLFGLGTYDAVPYRWGDAADSPRTKPRRLLPHALVELYPKVPDGDRVNSVVVVGSDAAGDRLTTSYATHWKELQRELQGRSVFRPIPLGDTQSGQRLLFRTLIELMALAPMRGIETEPPSGILLDITHGLKPQALVVGAAVLFQLAEFVRRGNVTNVPIRVVYAKFDPNEDGRRLELDPSFAAPIWELTEYLNANLWTMAIQAAGYGQASATAIMARQESVGLQRELEASLAEGAALAPSAYIRQVGDAVHQFTEASTCLRAERMRDSAGRLARLLSDATSRAMLDDRAPAMKSLLDDLLMRTKAVLSEDGEILTAAGIAAMARTAGVFGTTGQRVQQAVVLREAYYALCRMRYQVPPPEPELATWTNRRPDDGQPVGEEEDRWLPLLKNADPQLGTEVRGVLQVRNDMAHFGLNGSPQHPKDIAERLDALTQALIDRTTARS